MFFCMKLLVIRHGVAEDKEVFAATGQSDELRPLTEKGRRKMQRAARGLAALVPDVALLATSPLVRAQQTAVLVAKQLGRSVDEEIDALRPDAPLNGFLDWLRSRRDVETVAVCGHEPHLSTLVSWLMSGEMRSQLELKKGGACLLSFGTRPKAAGATLLWLLTSDQLDAVGRR